MKIFRKFQKRFALPWKWAKKRKQVISSIQYPPKDEVYDQYEFLRKDIETKKRLSQDLEVARIEGRMEVLDWIMTYASKT